MPKVNMPVAEFVRSIVGWTGDARLYKLTPALKMYDWENKPTGETEYVIVSGTVAMYSGPETYIFPANADGEVTDWAELDGSFRGGIDHEKALAGAGYAMKGVTV